MIFLWYVTEQYGICPFQVYLLQSYELLIPQKMNATTMYREAGAHLQVYYPFDAHAAMHTVRTLCSVPKQVCVYDKVIFAVYA